MITKEQWEDIKSKLSSPFDSVNFMLDGKKLTVKKQCISDTQLAWIVYIDGTINVTWGYPTEETFLPLVEKVWHKKTKSLYTAKEKAKIIKIWGKRKAKAYFPELDKKMIMYRAMFSKYSVLEKQFKKIDGLELSED